MEKRGISAVVAVYDGSESSIWIDGVKKGIDTVEKPINSGDEVLYIGKLAGTGYEFDGLIDEVMIFSRALKEEEVADLHDYFS